MALVSRPPATSTTGLSPPGVRVLSLTICAVSEFWRTSADVGCYGRGQSRRVAGVVSSRRSSRCRTSRTKLTGSSLATIPPRASPTTSGRASFVSALVSCTALRRHNPNISNSSEDGWWHSWRPLRHVQQLPRLHGASTLLLLAYSAMAVF